MISFEMYGYELRKISTDKSPYTSKIDGKSRINNELCEEILEKLCFWELQKGFLDNYITLHTLAKELNTNSTYLSQVINSHKNQNFASYLKDIRIAHAISDLKINPDIIKSKSMIHIAEMYGFNSIGVFSKAFKDKIGATPGVFFKRILEDEWKKKM